MKEQVSPSAERLPELEAALHREQALARENAMLRAMVESSHDPAIFVADPQEAGRFLYVNEATCRHFGVSREQLLTQHPYDYDPSMTPDRLNTLELQLRESGYVSFESEHHLSSGRRVPVEVKLSCFEHDGRSCVAGYFRDITERRAFESLAIEVESASARHAESERYRQLFTNFEDSILFMDATETGGFVISSINSAAERTFGLKDAEAQGQSYYELFPPSLAVRLAAQHHACVQSGKSVRHEEVFSHPSGDRYFNVTLIPMKDDEEQVYRIAVILRNISERKRAEALLAQRERAFRTLAENAPDNIARYDRECRLFYFNPQLEATLGVQHGELFGNTPTESHPEGHFEAYEAALKQVIATGEMLDVQIALPDRGIGGSYHHVRMTPERDEHGEVTGVLAIGRDVTEQKRYEYSLLDRVEQERRLSQFFSVVPGFFYTLVQRPDGEFYVPFASVGIRQMFGVEPEAVAHGIAPFIALVHPDDIESLFVQAEMSARELKFGYIEFRINHPTKGERWIASRAQPQRSEDGGTRWDGFMHDITERKRAETVLREGEQAMIDLEEKLLDLYELSPVGIVLTDMDGHFLKFNEAFRRLCGYSAEALKAQDYWSLTPPEFENRQVEQQLALSQTGSYGPCEQELLDQAGARVAVQVSGTLISGKDGQHYIWSIVEDITARKQAETSLKQAHEFTEGVINAIPDLLFELDRDGRYLGIWTKKPELLVAQREALLGNTVNDALSPEAAQIVMSALREAAEKGLSFGKVIRIDLVHGVGWFELSVSKKNGSDSAERFLVLSRDITARKQMEADLALLGFAVNRVMGDAFFLIDEAARFVQVNDQACHSLGYSREELTRMTIFDVDPDFTSEHWGEFLCGVKAGVMQRRFKSRHRGKDGRLFPVEIAAQCFVHEGKVYDLAIARDLGVCKRECPRFGNVQNQ